MTFVLKTCTRDGCVKRHGVAFVPKARTARKAPDDSAGAGALRSGDIGSLPGAQSSTAGRRLTTAEGRKALSTTG